MKQTIQKLAFAVSFLCISAVAALAADPIVGTWKTQPDKKNLISHIQITACGADFCGLILEAFNSAGKKVSTPNIGKKLFWGVQNKGSGDYSGGTFWVPLVDKDVDPKFKLTGDSLLVKGCELDICESQTWTRL